MCGIVAVIDPDCARDRAERLLQRLAHRGHAGCADEVCVESLWALGSNRLPIESHRTQRQPRQSSDGVVSVVYNGEVYNWRQLLPPGHCDIRVTERYSHLETGMLQEAMEGALSLDSRRPGAKGAELPQWWARRIGNSLKPLGMLAGATGIEPATSGFGDPMAVSEHSQNPQVLRLLEELKRCILAGNDSN